MLHSSQETCPLPDDPVLAGVAAAYNDAGVWGHIYDHRWRTAYMTDDFRLSNGGLVDMAPVPLGAFLAGTDYGNAVGQWRGKWWGPDGERIAFSALAPWMVVDLPGGRDELRELIDPLYDDLIDGIVPDANPASITYRVPGPLDGRGVPVQVRQLAVRIRGADGRLVGTAVQGLTAAGMAVVGSLNWMADLRHFERMQAVATPARRPAAILFCDLEASSPLSRRLSTASYFALGRRLTRAADQCVIDAGGLVGRHVGDGVVAFFLADTAGSESTAARNAITAARELREAVGQVAERSDLQPGEVVLRFGLHWGATLYVGNITTGGRSEVTALGDQVNECARIEACASGGLTLASKDLMERLDAEDAAALDLDPDRVTYTALADLANATDKARRDAPAIAVCEV